jgi:hypothetical protein
MTPPKLNNFKITNTNNKEVEDVKNFLNDYKNDQRN